MLLLGTSEYSRACSVWQLYSVIYCAAIKTERIFSFFIYKRLFKLCTSRDVWMNLLSVNSGPEMVFVQNMHLSWFTIVENLVELVEWDQVSFFLLVYFFKLKSTLTYFLDVVSMSQIVNGKDFSDLWSPNFCKYNKVWSVIKETNLN